MNENIIKNSENDKFKTMTILQDSALFILSAARQALDATGDTAAPGAHGKVVEYCKLTKISLVLTSLTTKRSQGQWGSFPQYMVVYGH